MKKELKWSSSVEFDKNQIKQKVTQLETEWLVKLPQEYLEIVLNYDGALPYIKDSKGEWKSAGVKLPKGEKPEGIELLSLKEKEFRGNIVTTIELSYKKLIQALPPQLYPFANNGSGDALLFDYRKSNEPEVVFIDHDDLITEEWVSEEELSLKPLEAWQSEKIYPVCSSFKELLDMISLIEN